MKIMYNLFFKKKTGRKKTQFSIPLVISVQSVRSSHITKAEVLREKVIILKTKLN